MGEHRFPEVHNALFPAGATAVHYWENSLKMGLQRSKEEVEYVLAHKVMRIGIYKERSHPQHEFTIAEVLTDEKKTRYYCLERLVRRKANTQNSGEALSLLVAQTSSFSSSSDSSLHLLARPTSYDTVRMEKGRPKEHCGKAVNFRRCSVPPTILDLSMLGATLHDNSLNYQLLQRQCYWFAAMLLLVLNANQPEGVLEAETKACPICVECEKVPEEVEQVTEELEGIAEIEPNNMEEFEELEEKNRHKVLIAGTYWGVRISKPTMKNAERIQRLLSLRHQTVLDGVSRFYWTRIHI